MTVAGLTGGIASGKSTVSAFFQNAGAVIIDADKIAREMVKKRLPAWEKIRTHFGPDVLLPDGEINREWLGNIIFHQPEEKEILNAIVHPYVFMEMEKEICKAEKTHPDCIVIQDIPLLFESKMEKKISPVIVVYVPERLQLERLMKRNGLSENSAMARIRSQMSIEEKKKLADFVIDNSGSLEDTREKTMNLFMFLKKTALDKS
ncbi:MAG: dephospho-CoA kinase [Desulfococcaceae bacterium]